MAKRLLRFLKAAGRIGGSSVIFGLLLFAITLWEHLKGRNVPASWCVGAGVSFFCYGCYLAWSKESDEAANLATRLASEQPCISIATTDCLNVFDEPSGRHVFFLSTVILNTGAPTSIIKWEAFYQLNGSSEQMELKHLTGSYAVILQDNVKIFTQKDLMQSILSQTRIERHASFAGRLLFAIPGDRKAQTATCNFTIKVSCWDSAGNESVYTYRPESKSGTYHNWFPHEDPPISREVYEAAEKAAAAVPRGTGSIATA